MKTKTRILSMLLAIVMLFGITSGINITAFAAISGDGEYRYALLEDGTAEITRYYGSATELTIPSKIEGYAVTSIGRYAFENCIGLTSITIPNSVTSIKYAAFYKCTGLTSITIPTSVTSMEDYAFAYCESLTSVIIPGNVTSIADYAFFGCTSLTSIMIPSSVILIGKCAFYNCTGLTRITIPSSVTSIGTQAFYNCTGLTRIAIPGRVTSIETGAFAGCSGLTAITIQNGVTSIGAQAFYNCTGLTSITIPDSVKTIGESAFSDCTGLTSITIPNSVKTIGESAFSGCTGLTNITIPSSVTLIKVGAFANCDSLIKVSIMNKNCNIEKEADDGVGFRFPTFPRYTVIGGYKNSTAHNYAKENFYTFYDLNGASNQLDFKFDYTGFTDSTVAITGYVGTDNNVIIPDELNGKEVFEICSGAFSNNTELTNVSIPASVTTIGDYAFAGCEGLKSVTIPDSVKSIGDFAFSYCTGLTSINIPNSVTSIGDRAFFECTGLTGITIYNKNCTFAYADIPTSTTIYGYTGSTAQTYAKENGNKFAALDAPTKLDAPKVTYTVNSNRTFTISWNSIEGANQYEVYFSNDGGKTYNLTRTTSDTSVTTGTAAFGTVFKYQIRAVNYTYNIKSAGSNIVDAVNDKYLSTPTATYAVNTDRTFTISWNKVTGADKYEVYYSGDGGDTYKLKTTTTALSCKTGTAAFGTTYKYKVHAVNSANNVKSEYCTVSAVNNKYLPAPTAKYAVNADRTFTISWNKVTGSDKYEVYAYNTSTGKYYLSRTTTNTSVKTGTAAFGTIYKYIIKAVNSVYNVKSSDSNVVNAVNNKYLPAPTATYIVNTDRTFTISWNKVTGADKYEVYYSNDGGNTYKLKTTTTALSCKTGTAAFGTTYKYKVRAVNSTNNVKSAYSAVVNAVNNKYLPAPTARCTVNSDCTLTISWSKITGADKYEIYFSNDDGKTYKYVRTTAETSTKSGKAPYGVNYKYKIRAVNSENNVKSPYCTVNAVNNIKLTTPSAKLAVNTDGTFTISWGKVTGATKYEVYIFDSKLNDYRLSRTSTDTSVTTTKGAVGVTYKYKVRAITSENASATSDFSAVVIGKR